MKMLNETRKIMHAPDLPLSSTCVRVPVTVSHSAAVHIEFENDVEPDSARAALEAFRGISVVDEPQRNQYPMPRSSEGRDEVLVGRIRRDLSHAHGIALWIACDNLRKGAALNALQILDETLRRDCLRSRGSRVQAG
jgi:aspartate-semialdehyde dehydrogenase